MYSYDNMSDEDKNKLFTLLCDRYILLDIHNKAPRIKHSEGRWQIESKNGFVDVGFTTVVESMELVIRQEMFSISDRLDQKVYELYSNSTLESQIYFYQNKVETIKKYDPLYKTEFFLDPIDGKWLLRTEDDYRRKSFKEVARHILHEEFKAITNKERFQLTQEELRSVDETYRSFNANILIRTPQSYCLQLDTATISHTLPACDDRGVILDLVAYFLGVSKIQSPRLSVYYAKTPGMIDKNTKVLDISLDSPVPNWIQAKHLVNNALDLLDLSNNTDHWR